MRPRCQLRPCGCPRPSSGFPLKPQEKLHSLQKVVEGGRVRLGRRPLTLRCEEGVHGRLVVVARAAAGRTSPWRCEPSTCRHTCAPSAAWDPQQIGLGSARCEPCETSLRPCGFSPWAGSWRSCRGYPAGRRSARGRGSACQ